MHKPGFAQLLCCIHTREFRLRNHAIATSQTATLALNAIDVNKTPKMGWVALTTATNSTLNIHPYRQFISPECAMRVGGESLS